MKKIRKNDVVWHGRLLYAAWVDANKRKIPEYVSKSIKSNVSGIKKEKKNKKLHNIM